MEPRAPHDGPTTAAEPGDGTPEPTGTPEPESNPSDQPEPAGTPEPGDGAPEPESNHSDQPAGVSDQPAAHATASPPAATTAPSASLAESAWDDEDWPDPDDPDPSRSVQAKRLAALGERIEAFRQRVVPRLPEATPTGPRRVWLLTFYVLRRWLIEDRCAGMAAQLTMQTLLSIIPFFGVALLFVGQMDPDSGNALLEDLFRSLIPETDRANEMASGAMALAKRVNVSNLGTWGILVSLSIAFVLFSTLERTFNRI
ncbi:MAG: hypothetical protein KDK70_39855, partial [Myxococcales bacterium]|nr:hypothetical protein [Myxococcales bacterium]